MIWTIFPFVLVAILVAGILVSDLLACRFVHISTWRLTGEDPQEKFLQGSESCAVMDEYGTMQFLSLEDAQMTEQLNSKLCEEKAYGMVYLKEAPELKKFPPLATPKLSP